MTATVQASDVERFRTIVSRRFGFQLGETETRTLTAVLQRHLAADDRPCDAFLAHLERGPVGRELRAIAAELTVPETYFFRNVEQFHALRDVVLPDRARARAGTRQLRFLSAGARRARSRTRSPSCSAKPCSIRRDVPSWPWT